MVTEFNVAKHVQASTESAEDAALKLSSGVGVRSKVGKKLERQSRTPENISWRTFTHCLLGHLDLPPEKEEQACWDELSEILEASGRPGWPNEICVPGSAGADVAPGSAGVDGRRAVARKVFVAALAEWVNLHDLNAPFPMGPPGKDQAGVTVDGEHSAQALLM